MGFGSRSDTPNSGPTGTATSAEKENVSRGGRSSGSSSSSAAGGGNRWCLIESDPGVFTELVEKLGVQGVAFEEVFGLDESSFASLQSRKPLGLQSENAWEGSSNSNSSSNSSSRSQQQQQEAGGGPPDEKQQQQKMDVDMQEQVEEKEEEMQETQQQQEGQTNKHITHKQQQDEKEEPLRKIFGFIFLFNWSTDKKGSRAAKPNRSPASAAAGAAALARQQKAAKEEACKANDEPHKAEDAKEEGENKKDSTSSSNSRGEGEKESVKEDEKAPSGRPSSSSSTSSTSNTDKTSAVDNYPQDLFFARQVIPNACASQAILSVLINKRKEISDVGPTVGALVEFTKDFFDPFMRGEAIGNSEAIREAHNSFKSCSSFYWTHEDDEDEQEDAFHFVSYIYFRGCAYEIDGLEEAPKCLGTCTEKNWIEVVRQQLLRRVAKIQEKATGELRFNLMAVVEDELSRVQKEILRQKILAQRANVKRICLGEDLTLDEEVEDDHLDATDIPSIEQLPEDLEQLRNVVCQAKEKRRLLELRELEELDTRARWKKENIRRRHDFVPFLLCVLRHVARRGELVAAVEAAREAAARRRQSREKKTTASAAAAPTEGTGKKNA